MTDTTSVCLHIQDSCPRFVFGLGNLQPLVIPRLGLDARELLLRGLLGCGAGVHLLEEFVGSGFYEGSALGLP